MWLPQVIKPAGLPVHVHGHARHFHAHLVIDHDLIVTSLYVQVPTDTRRLSALPSDLISALIFGLRAVLGSMMYLRRGYTVNTTLFGHHRCRVSSLGDLA